MAEDTTPAPVVETPAQAPEAAPAVEVAAPVVEAPAEAAPVEQPSSLLGDDVPPQEPKKDDVPPVEAPKEGEPAPEEPKKEEASQSDEPAPLPTYEPFTLPEGVEVDKETLGAFVNELATFENLTKADHAEVQKLGQTLIDKHNAALTAHTASLQEYYQNAWETQKNTWKDAFEADPDIGGNRRDTTLKHAKTFIRTYGGDETQQKELTTLMNETGIGNHPALIRILAKAGESLAEGRPLPATGAAKGVQSKVAKRYGQQ